MRSKAKASSEANPESEEVRQFIRIVRGDPSQDAAPLPPVDSESPPPRAPAPQAAAHPTETPAQEAPRDAARTQPEAQAPAEAPPPQEATDEPAATPEGGLRPEVIAEPGMQDRLEALHERVQGVAVEQQELREAAEKLKNLESKLSNLAQLSELLSARYNPFLVREAADEFEGDILRELVAEGGGGREIVQPELARATRMNAPAHHASGPGAPTVDHLPPVDPEAHLDGPPAAAQEGIPAAAASPPPPQPSHPHDDAPHAAPAIEPLETGPRRASATPPPEPLHDGPVPRGEEGLFGPLPTADAPAADVHEPAPPAARVHPDAEAPTTPESGSRSVDPPLRNAQHAVQAAPAPARARPATAEKSGSGWGEPNWELERAHVALRWFEQLLSAGDPHMLYAILERFEALGWIDARLYNWLKQLAEGLVIVEDDAAAHEFAQAELLEMYQRSLRFVEQLNQIQARERQGGAQWD